MSQRRQTERHAFGHLLIELRGEKGQHEFARQLGISRSRLAAFETREPVSVVFRDILCERLPHRSDEIRRVWNQCFRGRPASNEGGAEPPDVGLEDTRGDMFLRRSGAAKALEGTWYALWQTSVEKVENLNHEVLKIWSNRNGQMIIENEAASEDNPKGGYLWRGEGRLFDNRYFLGYYIARDPAVLSKGVMTLVVHRSGKHIMGRWMGPNYDSEWAHGLVVISREVETLASLMEMHRQELPKMPYDFRGEDASDNV